MTTALVIAMLTAICFSGSGLLALFGSRMGPRARSYAIAAAAGILLVLAFGELFPEGLELAGKGAVAGFIGGFALLFLVETLTRAHTHHSPDEPVHKHALTPFVLGLAIHNLADGIALGISGELSEASAAAVGLGVFIHQLPVGLSLAAVFAAAYTTRLTIVRLTILLGLAIPAATAVTLALPGLSDRALGILVGVAGGVLAYLSAAHLLPEAQTEHPGRLTGAVFTATMVVMTVGMFTVLGH